ncbi:hypothetical protein L7F22_011077 [Adiantum nelumboides]|nr:hypothetical protein [Adiantum nelumboides]
MPLMQTARSIAPLSTVNLRQDHEAYQSYQAKPQGMAHGYLSNDHGAHWKPDQVPIQSTKTWEFERSKVEIVEDLEEKHPLINKPNVRFIKTNEAMRVLTDYAYDGLYRLPIGDQKNFYRCLNPIIEELTDYKNLYAFTYTDSQGMQAILVDKYGREYKLINQIELKRYTCMGTPIPAYYFQLSVSASGLFETNLQEAETQTMGSIGPEISKEAVQGSVAPTSLSGTERPPIRLRECQTVQMVQAEVTEAKQAKVAKVEFKALQALILAPPPAPAMTTSTMVDPKGKLSSDLHSHPDTDEEDCKQDDGLEIDAWMQHFGGKRKAFGPGAALAHYISTLLAGERGQTVQMAQAEVMEAEQAKVAKVEFKALQALILTPPPAPAMATPTMVDPKGKLSIDLHSHSDTDEEDCKQDVYIMFIA